MKTTLLQDMIFEHYDDNNSHHRVAVAKAGYHSTFAAMKPLSRQRVKSFDYSLLAFGGSPNVFLGHVAVVAQPDKPHLLSGLIINPLFAGCQVGSALLEYAASDIPQSLPDLTELQAYANEESLKLFQKMGGILLGPRLQAVTTGCVHVVDLTPMLKGADYENQTLAEHGQWQAAPIG